MKHVIVFFWCHLQRWMPLIIWDKCSVASCGRSSLSFTQVNPANPQYKLQILFIWSTAHCSFWEHLVFIQQDRTVLLYLYLISWQDRPNDSSPEKGRCKYFKLTVKQPLNPPPPPPPPPEVILTVLPRASLTRTIRLYDQLCLYCYIVRN